MYKSLLNILKMLKQASTYNNYQQHVIATSNYNNNNNINYNSINYNNYNYNNYNNHYNHNSTKYGGNNNKKYNADSNPTNKNTSNATITHNHSNYSNYNNTKYNNNALYNNNSIKSHINTQYNNNYNNNYNRNFTGAYYRNHRNGKYNSPTSIRAAHVNIPFIIELDDSDSDVDDDDDVDSDDDESSESGSNSNGTSVELNADNTSDNSSELDSITTPFLRPSSPGEPNYQNNMNRKTLLKKFPINKYTVDELNDYITNIIKCLQTGQYECKVCYKSIMFYQKTWTCQLCCSIFHLPCIKKFATNQIMEVYNDVWKCPGCDIPSKSFPNSYHCFCGTYE